MIPAGGLQELKEQAVILALPSSVDNPGRLISDLVCVFDTAGTERLISTVPALFLRFENSARTQR